MLTTAGSTFFTMGAKLGICTIAFPGACVCANVNVMGAAASATVKTAPTASRRKPPADIVKNIMDQPRLKESAVANGTASDASPVRIHRHHGVGRITPPLRFD